MKAKKTPKHESKEAYRLWFEFLKRALAEDRSSVDLKFYAEWGNLDNSSFTKWWREVGEQVTAKPLLTAELVESGSADDFSYLVRLPKSLTSTQIGNEVRKLLIEIEHKPIKQSQIRITDGFQVRPFIYRAYLHTYDAQRRLEKLSVNGKVSKKDLLIAVRKTYLAKQKRYANNIFKVDVIPPPLMGHFDPENPDDHDTLRDRQETANVARYLSEAEKIIAAVKIGRFPR
jgi:hypothetical protein